MTTKLVSDSSTPPKSESSDPTRGYREGQVIGQPQARGKTRRETNEASRARASTASMDVRAEAWQIMLSIMRGANDDPRMADIQRRACLDVLDLTSLEYMSNGELSAHADSVLAEIQRRKAAKP